MASSSLFALVLASKAFHSRASHGTQSSGCYSKPSILLQARLTKAHLSSAALPFLAPSSPSSLCPFSPGTVFPWYGLPSTECISNGFLASGPLSARGQQSLPHMATVAKASRPNSKVLTAEA